MEQPLSQQEIVTSQPEKRGPLHRSPFVSSWKKFFRSLGPGIITGASDDDPSGIATYSQAGSQNYFSSLWTSLYTIPLMAGIQEMCARIGLVSGHGLAGNMKRYYPKWVLYGLVGIMCIASTINIGADIGGMAAALTMLIPLPVFLWAILSGFGITLLIIKLPYHTIARYLKYAVLALFAYFFVPFIVKTDWTGAILYTLVPQISLNKKDIALLVGVLGTTISPYLFFWQANVEIEDKMDHAKKTLTRWLVTKHEMRLMQEDVTLGMVFSNIVMWFIIVTTATVLNRNGITDIETAAQAADALRPFAGEFARILFAVGIVGAGMLAIPVLAGSASYAVSEIFGWEEGLNKKFHEARAFYAVIAVATGLGMLINLLGLNPMKMLLYAAIINGIAAPPLIALIMHMGNNKQIMKGRTNGVVSNILGGLAFVVMAGAAIALFVV